MGDADDGSKPTSNWTDNSGYTHLELYPDGTYKSFVPEIDTEWVIGGRTIVLKATLPVKFHPNGQLERCVLAAKATLDVHGVVATVGANDALEFHSDGGVRSFTLGPQSSWIPWLHKEWSFGGTTYAEGTRLEFSADGKVVFAEKRGGR